MDEKDLSEKIKNLDFSRYTAEHKEHLWKTLNEKSDRRVLIEHELNIAAAGTPESSTRICVKCGSKNINNKGQCGNCKYLNLLQN